MYSSHQIHVRLDVRFAHTRERCASASAESPRRERCRTWPWRALYTLNRAIYFHLCVRREGGDAKFITDAFILSQRLYVLVGRSFFAFLFSRLGANINYHFVHNFFAAFAHVMHEETKGNESHEKLRLIFLLFAPQRGVISEREFGLCDNNSITSGINYRLYRRNSICGFMQKCEIRSEDALRERGERLRKASESRGRKRE